MRHPRAIRVPGLAICWLQDHEIIFQYGEDHQQKAAEYTTVGSRWIRYGSSEDFRRTDGHVPGPIVWSWDSQLCDTVRRDIFLS